MDQSSNRVRCEPCNASGGPLGKPCAFCDGRGYVTVGPAIPKRAATTVGVDEMLAQSDPEATQIAHATRNSAAELEKLRSLLWELWRRGYVELDDLRECGFHETANAIEKAARGA